MSWILVEPAKESRIHLAHMMLDDPIQLLGSKITFKVLRQLDQLDELIERLSLIGKPNRLIPDELNRVAIQRERALNLLATGRRRAVGTNLMHRFESHQIIEALQQDARISIFLATNGKDIEERWPKYVVHRKVQRREPQGNGVGGIRRRHHDLNGQARNR